MLKLEKGKKIIHYVCPQRTLTFFDEDSSLDIHREIDKYIKENTCREVFENLICEEKAFVDHVTITATAKKMMGATEPGLNVSVYNKFQGIAVVHKELWHLVNEDAPEDDPDIADIKYFEGGWM